MNKLKKTLLKIGLGLLALIVIAMIVVGFFLGTIIKTGVETVGPKIAKVPIKVGGVGLSVLGCSASIKELVVGNPEGYKTPQAISVGRAAVSVNPFSVLSDKIVVRSVRVEAPEITFEGNPLGANNLTKIMDNVTAVTKSSEASGTNAPAGEKPAKKIEVDDLLITGAKVHVSIGGSEMTLPLPDIHLTDLGKGEGGLTPADLTKRVLSAITTSTLKAVVSGSTNIGKGIQNLGKNAGETAGKVGDKITKGIGGLFKK